MIKNADVMKNIFSPILRIAASVSAILLFAMCSKSDIIPDNLVPEDSSSDIIHVSVNASVSSIDVRSTFGNNKITIVEGDNLLVEAYHKEGESYTYYYSGTLTNTADAPGSFSGDLERNTAYGSYSGSNILTDAAVTATLLPKDVDTSVQFYEGISDENVANLCTMKATKAEGSAPNFSLKPSVAVARFTINGLNDLRSMINTDQQTFISPAYILVKYIDNNSDEHSVEGVATVSEGGVATFSVGIASTGTVKSLTLGIRGETENVHIDSRVWYDGIIIVSEEKEMPDIINITRKPVKTKYSSTSTTVWNPNPDTFDSGDIGKIFATNGHLFSSVATCQAAGVTPLCMLTCLKSMIANPAYTEDTDVQMQNGLAMGLYPRQADGITKFTWRDIYYYRTGSYRHCDGGVTLSCADKMPKMIVMQRMAQCCGSRENFVTGGSVQLDPKNYDSSGLADLLVPAINALNGTNYTSSNITFWIEHYYTSSQQDYPLFWNSGGFSRTTDSNQSPSTTMESYTYYMF